MSDLKICRICLRTEAKGYKFERFQLKHYYEEVIALQVNNDGLPQWFCFECATMLHKFHKFKEKCYIGQKVLKEMLWQGPITYEAVYKIDRSNRLQSPLETITVTDRIKTFNIVKPELESFIKREDDATELEQLVNTNSINNVCYIENVESLIKADIDNVNESSHNNDSSNEMTFDEMKTHSPLTIIVDGKSNIVKIKPEDISTIKTKDLEASLSLKELSGKYFSEGNWKMVHLTEEEAVKEFRAKAEDPKYLDSTFKCRDCFKGFSKKYMLNRHVQSRHSEELGPHECRFCRMRFKWHCHLRKHIQQHFTKYECLRCHIVFNLDTSAFLHEEYHSGITKKCVHCNEEFRHVTTYYTHLRTHRSAHVCGACGASFVSAAGLAQHRRRAHALSAQNTSEEDDEVDTFCETCDIRFETSKAYEEHLFHSDMHTEFIKRDQDDAPTKKILGKRLRDKITKELRKRNCDTETTPLEVKRRKKNKRKFRKPSTCHQCGQQFESQAACMKHHVAEHPRTSYYAPAQRHICELCGASLAPGSVAVHQNMHSREKVHTCDTCGRQFHSSVGLKRHLITHTGEKPFGCPLCDKRFTQSNSMKLHYRTFHLKQPYPKRSRKKKKDETNQTEQEDAYEEESDSVPEPETEVTIPEIPLVEPATAHVIGDVNVESIEDENNMHYLTLS